jgi:4-hydroxy-2-oxoheptanedioate aldolase
VTGRHASPLDRGALRARVAGGEKTLGTFVSTASAVTAEVCAASGMDWLILDLEHGSAGEDLVGAVVLAAAAYGVPTVVRVESAARIRLGRVLDLGAAGVMLPRLDAASEVGEALRHLRYPPEGDRGVATSIRAHRFGLDTSGLEAANGEVLGVVQIESVRAVDQVEEIAALDGADVLFVGPRDLSHDLGVPGDFRAAPYLAALDRVRAAADTHGKASGLVVPDGTAAVAHLQDGWTFVAIGSDSTLLASALTAALARARSAR